MNVSCSHLDTAGNPRPQSTQGCQGCLALGRTDWVHLRLCLTCGRVGCCDSSPLRHASAHFAATGHPVMRSFQPGETWRWCYVDELLAP
jgi:uncharacterized UBP type Zn finger protein